MKTVFSFVTILLVSQIATAAEWVPYIECRGQKAGVTYNVDYGVKPGDRRYSATVTQVTSRGELLSTLKFGPMSASGLVYTGGNFILRVNPKKNASKDPMTSAATVEFSEGGSALKKVNVSCYYHNSQYDRRYFQD